MTEFCSAPVVGILRAIDGDPETDSTRRMRTPRHWPHGLLLQQWVTRHRDLSSLTANPQALVLRRRRVSEEGASRPRTRSGPGAVPVPTLPNQPCPSLCAETDRRRSRRERSADAVFDGVAPRPGSGSPPSPRRRKGTQSPSDPSPRLSAGPARSIISPWDLHIGLTG